MAADNMALGDIFQTARAHGASDIHLTTGQPPVLRINGDLRRLDTPGWTREAVIAARDWLIDISHDLPADRDAPDLDFARSLDGGERLRVNSYTTLNGPALAIRRLVATPPALDDLPAPPAVADLANRASGLVLVTGATGCGKSTTLAALIDRINTTRAAHIVTIEDPVEYVHSNKKSMVNQREIGQHTHSFHTGLRAALREDPDVILVGEMRDLETISLALTAAETGQLVLATLHAPTAAQAVDRIVDVFPGNEKELVRTMLSASMLAVVSQRLLPAIDGGRAAAMEIMLGTSAVRNQIREGKVPQLSQSIELGRRLGMQSMSQAINDLEKAGRITAEVGAHWLQALGHDSGSGESGQDAETERPQGGDTQRRPSRPQRF